MRCANVALPTRPYTRAFDAPATRGAGVPGRLQGRPRKVARKLLVASGAQPALDSSG
jgi:hypothetical protein